MSKYDQLIDEIRMAEVTGSPCVLVTCYHVDGESATDVHHSGIPLHSVVGLLAYGQHIATHKTEFRPVNNGD
jgi:hypothetical protein